MRSKTGLTLSSFALALALVSTSASAKNAEFVYNPTELATAAGAEQVYKRLHTFAADMCGREFGRFSPRHQLKIKRCTSETKQEIIGKISHTNLDKVSKIHPDI